MGLKKSMLMAAGLATLVTAASACVPNLTEQEIAYQKAFETMPDLAFSALETTPITEKNVMVFVETEQIPEARPSFLAHALGFVKDFYQQYGINISFVPVEKIDQGFINSQTTFGLTYASRKKVEAETEKLGNKLLKGEIGKFNAEAGRLFALTESPYERTYQLIGGKHATPEDRVNIYTHRLASTIAHELGHMWGLFHTDLCSDDGIPNSRDNIPNLMDSGFSVPADEQNPQKYIPKLKLNEILEPIQVSIIHNFLSGGSVAREIQTYGFSTYTNRILLGGNHFVKCMF